MNAETKTPVGARLAVLVCGLAFAAGAIAAEAPATAPTPAPAPAVAPAAVAPTPPAGGMGGHDMKGMNGKGGGMMQNMMDANQDGKVSKEEFLKHHEHMFDMMDKDKNGVLDDAEMGHKGGMGGGGMGNMGGMQHDGGKPATGVQPMPEGMKH